MTRSSPETEDDPTASQHWNAGCDFALAHLCKFLGVDFKDVSWDAATETVDGDVLAVIGNILRAKFGEDWGPSDGHAQRPAPPAALVDNFNRLVRIMKSARNSEDHMMCVWADDMKVAEDVAFYLSTDSSTDRGGK